MNVVYIDIDGVLNTCSVEDSINEEKIKILSKICQKYDCKVVIESTHKPVKSEWQEESPLILKLYELLEKYNIECIGFTPLIEITEGYSSRSCWKDYEILYHLMNHPEIEHFVVIDDNDFPNLDLVLLKDYFIETKAYVPGHPEKEGLIEEHIEEVGKKLKLTHNFPQVKKNKKTT